MQKNCYIPPPQLHKSTWNLPTLSHPLHLQRHNYTDLRENAAAAAAAAKSPQLCPTLCDPIDGSPPGSPVPGILQARTLEWVAISFSNAGKRKVKVKSLSRVRPLATPWTAAHQAPPSMGFSRQEYWSGVPLLSPRENATHLKFFSTFIPIPNKSTYQELIFTSTYCKEVSFLPFSLY